MPRPVKTNTIKTEYLDIRIPADVKQMLVSLAEEDDRSLTAEIIQLIKQAYKQKHGCR